MYRLIAKGGDITDKSAGMSWNSDEEAVGAILSFDSLYDIPLAEEISLQIDGAIAFVGFITGKSATGKVFGYTATDYGGKLSIKTTKQFQAMGASAVISSLANSQGIACQCVAIPTQITKLYDDIPTMDIIREVLQTAADDQKTEYKMRMENKTLVVFKPVDKLVSPELTVKSGFAVECSLNDDGSTTTTASIEAVVLAGGNDIRAGNSIELHSGALSGVYKITSASHRLQNSRYIANIELELMP